MPPKQDYYLETQVLGATPYQLHLMVIDGALRAANVARDALTDGKRQLAFVALEESRRFVAELLSGLNPEAADGLVSQAASLFRLIHTSLAEADRLQEASLVVQAIELLEHHRATWVALEPAPEANAAPSYDPYGYGDAPSARDWSA